MKRFTIPRTAHCSSGCQFQSWVRRETALSQIACPDILDRGFHKNTPRTEILQ